MSHDAELLLSLSVGELEALSESMLAPAAQVRLDALLSLNTAHELSESEQVELDRLLERVDQLTLLKTRARYTLSQKAAASQA